MPTSLATRARREFDGWSVTTLLLSLLILLPLGTVLVGLFDAGPEWSHITSTVLGGYVTNTLILVATVSALSLMLAVPAAWLVSAYEFPARKVFEWALMMPLAIPTYVAAFVWNEVYNDLTPTLVDIRKAHGGETMRTVDTLIRYAMLSLLMASVLYPYLYIAARASFSQQRRSVIEAAQTLGRSPMSVFLTVALPLARPAIAAGLSLIVMEVVNDYGAVNLFTVPTMTEGIFRTLNGLGDRASGLRLAGLVMAAVLAMLLIERAARGSSRFAEFVTSTSPLHRRRLVGWRGVTATVACLVPLALGFVWPAGQLMVWAAHTWRDVMTGAFVAQLVRCVALALGTAAGLTAIAMLFGYATRLHHARWLRGLVRLSSMGYAMPGAVIAVGVMAMLGAVDDRTAKLITNDDGTGAVLLSGTVGAIVFAYGVRFFAVPFQPVQAGLTRVCTSLDEASRVLGRSPLATLCRINVPILRGTLLAATMLVFVDILKELPLTMLLRPAGFDTLAVTAFGLAKEGRVHECAVPSLIIVLAGSAGLIVLNRYMTRTR